MGLGFISRGCRARELSREMLTRGAFAIYAEVMNASLAYILKQTHLRRSFSVSNQVMRSQTSQHIAELSVENAIQMRLATILALEKSSRRMTIVSP